MESNYISLTEDQGVKKKILIEGTGDFPSDNLEVQVYYTGKLQSNGTVFDSTKPNNPFRFILSEGSVIRGWDIGVKSMRKGEKSEFILSPEYAYGEKGFSNAIPPNSTLNFEIELLDFATKAKSKYEMDYPEIISTAKQLKDEGIKFFKEQKFDEAILKFDDGFSYLESIDKSSVTNESQELSLSFLLNLSNCFNNIKQYEKTVKKIEEVLKIKEHPRCFYFRGVAYANLEDFPNAKADFEKLKSLVPENEPGLIYLRNLIEEKSQQKVKREKSLYKSFLKGSIYDDAPISDNPQDVPTVINPSNPRVFLDLKIGDSEEVKRIEFELFKDKVPKTAENFRALCTGEKSTEGKKLHYKNSIFHRIIKDFMMQGGDFENANGTGGCSIYGNKFDDEKFVYKHSVPGLLSMANSGPNTNGSQFFVTFKESPWLDGKHVVFGKVIGGMDVCREIEGLETNSQDVPQKEVMVVECGEITN